jgi:hypothetical protein
MTERPIIFSGPMVRALLAGRKTQTRRIVKGVDECAHGYDVVKHFENGVITCAGGATLKCPYGARGDRLWVRESFHLGTQNDGRKPSLVRAGSSVWYEADRERGLAQPGKLWPSIFMPRWASRISLEVVNVRVERLFDLSERDARAEGMLRQEWQTLRGTGWTSDRGQPTSATARRAFEDLWHSINGAWTDCWVWVVEFKKGTA